MSAATHTDTNARNADEVEWNTQPARQSWIWTCRRQSLVTQAMDDTTDSLIAQLCTCIGMLMEDGSVIALAAGGPHQPNRIAALTELQQFADKIQAATQAAITLAA